MSLKRALTIIFSMASLSLMSISADARISGITPELKPLTARIEVLNKALEKAIQKNKSRKVLNLLTLLARHHFHPGKMSEFRRYTFLLISEISKHPPRRVNVEQEVLAALGAIASGQPRIRVSRLTKAAVDKICTMQGVDPNGEYSLVNQAEHTMAQACWKLLEGDITATAELELKAYNFYSNALKQGRSLPNYVTGVSNKPLIIKVIEGRLCAEIDIFCQYVF